VDKLVKYLHQKGFNNFMVEIGGEIVVSGLNKDNQLWKIGILNPDGLHSDLYSTIEVSNKAVATSGIYQNYFTLEGIDYSHLINPITGFPVNHDLISATIVADDCATADAVATAVMVKGFERGLKWINSLTGIECFLIKEVDGGYYTGYSDGFNYLPIE
jgi:thiamine biosynthesis lipoprotein